MAIYLDSSGIVKRYIRETGIAWIQNLCPPASSRSLYTAHVTGAEVVAAMMRRTRRGEITAAESASAISDLQNHLRTEYVPVFITEPLIQRAMGLTQLYRLRGYDAIQLSAALELSAALITLGTPPLIFISADNDLNAAASAEGLQVDNPNAHP